MPRADECCDLGAPKVMFMCLFRGWMLEDWSRCERCGSGKTTRNGRISPALVRYERFRIEHLEVILDAVLFLERVEDLPVSIDVSSNHNPPQPPRTT